MKRKLVKCPICGKINKITIDNAYTCANCKTMSNINESEMLYITEQEREIEYLLNCFKKSIISNETKLIDKYIKLILDKEKENKIAIYYSIKSTDDKLLFLNSVEINEEDLYFILKFDILKNKSISLEIKREIINKLNNDLHKKALTQELTDNGEEDRELYDQLFNKEIKLVEYKNDNKEKFLAYTLIVASVFVAFLISLICSLTVYEDCVYGTIILIGILPSVLLSLGIAKLLNKDQLIIKILLFLVVFYLLTYIMTIPHHSTSFSDSFKDHFTHIINAIPDVLDSITKNSDIEWGPKDE